MKTLSAAMGDDVLALLKSVTMVLTPVYALLQYMKHTLAGLADTVPYNTLL